MTDPLVPDQSKYDDNVEGEFGRILLDNTDSSI
jgi:hypothetical protein